ncbi:MAG: beta-lactamase family protein [Ruminococcus sp.]|nr:beta-lactamase family protein [Ruminococcus sp.]
MTKLELHRYVTESTGNESNICQIYAIRNDATVFDECWRGYKTTDAVNVMSVTKGVMALLIGIAVDKGYIQNAEQKVLDFFPAYQVKRGEKTIYDVTLRHLLTMTAPYKYRSEPWTKVCTSNDWTKAALDLLGGRNGITGEFKYATLGIQILSGVIENASGMKCIDFANQYLFAPLGIPEHKIHGASDKDDQFDYLMNKAPKKNEWYSDPKDTVTAGWGLCLSAMDMAKIGELVLNSGVFDSRRVISGDWIEEMAAPRIALGERFGNMSYGYLWYRPYKESQVIAAIGDGGNVIYVNPEKNISVGVTGTFKPRIFDRIAFIEDRVLPLITK